MKKKVEIELVKGEAFELDPNKKYLLLIKDTNGTVNHEEMHRLGQKLRDEGFDNITPLIASEVDMQLVEKGDA